MKYVCEVDNKSCVINQEDISNPADAAEEAFKKIQKDLDYDKGYKVSVYSDGHMSAHYFQKREKGNFTCILDDINEYELEVDANSCLVAAIKGLLYTARDCGIEDKSNHITVKDDEGNWGTYKFECEVIATGDSWDEE